MSLPSRDRCGKPTKKGTACQATRHYWFEGEYEIKRADACWNHMDAALREAADRRKRQDEQAWQAYLAADPICWGWTVPASLEHWTYPQGDDINDQLSPQALAMVMGNPETRAAAILNHWQDGRCAICGHRQSLVEDHDHVTGLTRGYLCRGCNVQEGVYQDADCLFGRYRKRHPTLMLGLRIRYWDPVAGDYAPDLSAKSLAEREADKWTDAASDDIL